MLAVEFFAWEALTTPMSALTASNIGIAFIHYEPYLTIDAIENENIKLELSPS